MIALCLIWLKISAHRAGERLVKISSCIWTMHVFTIRGDFVNVPNDFVPVEFHIRLIAQIRG
jgi:hypothetical protein